MSDRALIVGAGLGGLLCGQILRRKGWTITLLEADEAPGGVLRPFLWEGVRCERGFHSVGGLSPGEPLEKLFRPLGLMDLPWYRASADEGFPFLRLNSRSEYELEHILAPYAQSTWRLEGGGETLINALSEGLDIRCNKKVTGIENQVLTCEDGSAHEAPVIISGLPPVQTLDLVKGHLRPSYGHRLRKMETGPEICTVHCLLEDGCVPWQSGAIFLEDLMIHFGEPGTGILELLSFGKGRPEEMIMKARRRLPDIRILKHHTTLSHGYGIRKHSAADFVAPRTPLPWLYLTGENLGLHGILGTTITAYNTCKTITT